MPLSGRWARMKPHSSMEGRAMANRGEDRAGKRWRRSAIAGWTSAATLIAAPLAAMFVMAATAADENVVVSRNEIVRTAPGQRTWRGSFFNQTGNVYTDVSAVILFLDGQGVPVGQATGRAARLGPGESLDMRATLPPGAARMQMYALRWRLGDAQPVALGPYAPWPFGRIQNGPKQLARVWG